MHLPNSGRIVLIDDKAEEVRPLLFALGRAAVPYIYYDGSIENLPHRGKPIGGIRFVFLDIELHGMGGQPPKTKASGITAILRRIISKTNGPYAIIFWTKHHGTIELVLKNCKDSDIPPVAWIDMEKYKWIKKRENEADKAPDLLQCEKNVIEQISETLHEKLKSIGAFSLYIEWENILHSSSKQFIAEFSSLVSAGDKWSRDTSFLFHNLYKAYVADNELVDPTEKFRCACHLMNRSFLDTLENKTNDDLQIPDGFELKDGDISVKIKARLNSSLFIDNNIVSRPATGNIYSVSNESILTDLKKNIFRPDKAPDEIRLCKVIITPECDLAQKKTIRFTNKDSTECPVHRVIFGVYYQISEDLKEERKRHSTKGQDARYLVYPIWNYEKLWMIVFHLGTLSFEPENSFLDKPRFRLKRELLFDLQSKSANHVNRLGNFLIM